MPPAPVKTADKFNKLVPVLDVRFTQDSIQSKFTDGHTFEELIDGLVAGTFVVTREAWLSLEAVEVNGFVWALDNRRLYCLKEFQKKCTSTVMVRLRVTRNKDPQIKDFLNKLTTENGGQSVRVRQAARFSGTSGGSLKQQNMPTVLPDDAKTLVTKATSQVIPPTDGSKTSVSSKAPSSQVLSADAKTVVAKAPNQVKPPRSPIITAKPQLLVAKASIIPKPPPTPQQGASDSKS